MKGGKELIHFLGKVMQNKELRENFKKNPKKVLEKETGVYFSEKIKLHVLEDTKDSYYVIIPLSGKIKIHEDYKVKKLSTKPTPVEVMKYLLTQIELGNKEAEKEPKEFLKKQGLDIPEEVKINIVRNTKDDKYIRIPRCAEKTTELSDFELQMIAGGKSLGGSIGGMFSAITSPFSSILGSIFGGGSSSGSASRGSVKSGGSGGGGFLGNLFDDVIGDSAGSVVGDVMPDLLACCC